MTERIAEQDREIERLTRELDLIKNHMPADVLAECVLRARDWNEGRVTMTIEEWKAHRAEIERLREQVATLESTYSYECSQVERLTRELKDTEEQLFQAVKVNIPKLIERHNALVDERDRLRAALEWYSNAGIGTFDDGKRAREALRPADEQR